jgi:hypothetical protein
MKFLKMLSVNFIFLFLVSCGTQQPKTEAGNKLLLVKLPPKEEFKCKFLGKIDFVPGFGAGHGLISKQLVMLMDKAGETGANVLATNWTRADLSNSGYRDYSLNVRGSAYNCPAKALEQIKLLNDEIDYM